jgi:hypothetical protein
MRISTLKRCSPGFETEQHRAVLARAGDGERTDPTGSLPRSRLPVRFISLSCFPCAALSLVALSAGPALADEPQAKPGVEACLSASEKGQQLRDEGKLLAAREAFVTCAQASCPALLQRDCSGWLADAEARLPSVVLTAEDPAGHETAEVRVALDGVPRLARIDGRAVPLDPGEHVLRFERPGSPAIEEHVLLHEGEQRRKVAVRFTSSSPTAAARLAPEAPPSRPTPAAVFMLGGVGLAGGAAFAALASVAKTDADELRATCAPSCQEADVDAVRIKLTAANAALGLGAAALGTAAILWLTRPGQASSPPSARVSLAPSVNGGIAVVEGRF